MMLERVFFYRNPFLLLILIPVIFNIHRTSRISTKIFTLLCLLLFIIFNLYKLQPFSFKIDLMLLLLYNLTILVLTFIDTLRSLTYDRAFARIVNEDNYIFDSEFKRYGFTYEEYSKVIMKKGTIKRSRMAKQVIVTEGSNFDKVILFIQIPERAFLHIKKGRNIIFSLTEGSWFGSLEIFRSYFNSEKSIWEVGIELINNDQKEVVWIEWHGKFFNKLIKKNIDTITGTKFLSMWGYYLCFINKKMTSLLGQNEQNKIF